MLTEKALHTMVYQAINTDPARFARTRHTAKPADTHRTEGAHSAYLQCLAPTVSGHHPMSTSPDDAAGRALHDALREVIRQAADTPDVPDYDAAVRTVRAVAATHAPAQHATRPMSMQDRILAALVEIGGRAGCQVNIQPEWANTGRMYITAATTFSTLVELSYQFNPDYCGLHLRGPAIEALGLQDSPPQFSYQHTTRGWAVGLPRPALHRR